MNIKNVYNKTISTLRELMEGAPSPLFSSVERSRSMEQAQCEQKIIAASIKLKNEQENIPKFGESVFIARHRRQLESQAIKDKGVIKAKAIIKGLYLYSLDDKIDKETLKDIKEYAVAAYGITGDQWVEILYWLNDFKREHPKTNGDKK